MTILESSKNNYSITIFNILLGILPISFIAGNLLININILLILITGLSVVFFRKLKIEVDLADTFLILYFLILLFSTFLNLENLGVDSFYKNLLYLRFLLLYFLVKIFFVNNLIKIKYFIAISFFCVSLIIIDILFLYSKNIFIVESDIKNNLYSFLFGDEKIAGGYLQKFLPYSILFFYKKDSDLIKKFLIVFLIAHLTATLISGNRMPMIMTLFDLGLIFLILKNLRIKIFISFVGFLLISLYLFNHDGAINTAYKNFYYKVFSKTSSNNAERIYKEEGIEKKLNEYNFFSERYSTHHGLLYYKTYVSFKEKLILGKGIKSIQKSYPGEIFIPHPHNYQLEILHDSGLVGFLLLSIFTFIKLFQSIKIFNSSISNEKRFLIALAFVAFVAEIWPIKSTGSMYSTFSGSTLWLTISLINIIFYKDQKKL